MFCLGGVPYRPVVVMGLWIAMASALFFVFYTLRHGREMLNSSHIVLLTTLSTALMPFLLPKMHERYFFTADMLALVLAFMRPRFIIIFLLLQISEVVNTWNENFPFIEDLLGMESAERRDIAACLNLTAICILSFYYYRDIIKSGMKKTNEDPRDSVMA